MQCKCTAPCIARHDGTGLAGQGLEVVFKGPFVLFPSIWDCFLCSGTFRADAGFLQLSSIFQ
jgi:hypothetical protein